MVDQSMYEVTDVFTPLFAQGTILIDHSRNPHCYPLTHVIEGVVTSMFAKTTCQQSPLPTALFGYISIGLSNLLLTPLMTFDGIYSPYSSLQYGLSIYQAMDTSLRAALKCGDQLLITPDSFEDSSERIMQGERNGREAAETASSVDVHVEMRFNF